MINSEEILLEEIPGQGGDLGVITLNRPQVLNSLNHSMIKVIYAALQHYATANNIKAVIIRAAEGRAFCAGGDLRLTHERWQANDANLTHFFRDEYQLNQFIFHFPKPYIALLDGITMGGGVGLAIHGSHRVATEKLLFAMPETAIGFFPDVGGTYFLPRLAGHMGKYLGLTGARINSHDCLALGLVQHVVSSTALTDIINALAQQKWIGEARQAVTALIDQFKATQSSSTLMSQQQVIDAGFAFENMEEIVHALYASPYQIAQDAFHAIAKKSPTSLKVTLHALTNGKQMNFDDCMRQEYELARRFLVGHDFHEGIRAIIIDKDHTPKWEPATLEAVSPQEVRNYFVNEL
jgi:enoyl-CoA hydratase